MSKFFQTADEDRQETSKKTAEIVEKSQEKLTKREQKMRELSLKIEETSKGKNFEKLFKKFMNEVKKFTPYFENNEIPEILKEFLNDKRIRQSKPMSELVEDFTSLFSNYNGGSNTNAEGSNSPTTGPNSSSSPTTNLNITNNSNKKRSNKKDIKEILLIEDDTLKEKEILSLENKNTEAYMALFSIYYRMGKPAEMIETMRNLIGEVNLDVYLGKIFELLGESNYGEYFDLLTYCYNYDNMNNTNDINDISDINDSATNTIANSINDTIANNTNDKKVKCVVEKRMLEFKFFKMNQCPENNHPTFRLLYFIRKNQWAEALEYFNATSFGDDKISLSVLAEFARFCVQNSHYELAFEIFVRCNGKYILEIYALCVILNTKLVGNPHFANFLELFKNFDSNQLALPSKDPFLEICRAFYSLNCLDFVTASGILQKVVGFGAIEELERSIQRIYNLSSSSSLDCSGDCFGDSFKDSFKDSFGDRLRDRSRSGVVGLDTTHSQI